MRADALSQVFKDRTSIECKTRVLNAGSQLDVVGDSRLMEADEAGTLARLKTIRLTFPTELIRLNYSALLRGRVTPSTLV
jgi:hypothetical protein